MATNRDALYTKDSSGNVTGLQGPMGVGKFPISVFVSPRIGIIGDSILAADMATPSTINFERPSNGIVNRALARLGGVAQIYSSRAVSGRTTTAILSNLTSGTNDLAALVAANVTHVVMNGGANDVVGTDSTNANCLAIWSILQNAGFFVIDIGCLPKSAAAGSNTLLQETAKAVGRNRYSQDYQHTQGGRYMYVNCYDAVAKRDTVANYIAGSYATGMSYDSTHPTSLGAETASRPLSKALAYLFPPSLFSCSFGEPSGATAGNLVTNPEMIGTAGGLNTGITGTVADGWATTRISGTPTAVGSSVARASSLLADTQLPTLTPGTFKSDSTIPGTVQRFVITPGAASTDSFVMYQNITIGTGTSIVAGTKIRAWFEAAWLRQNNGLLYALNMPGSMSGGVSANLQINDEETASGLQSIQDGGLFCSQEITVTAGQTSFQFWISMGVVFTGSAIDTVTVDIGRCFLGPVVA